MKRFPRAPQRGVATLIAVLLLLLVVGATLVIALQMAGTDVSDSAVQNQSVDALFLAESGLERGAYNYAASGTCSNAGVGAGATVYNLGSGGFTLVSAAPDAVNPALCQIRVSGKVSQATRTVDGWFSGSGGTIAFETANSISGTTSGKTISVPVTVGAAGRLLVVGITVDAANSNTTGVTYAGQTLTQQAGAGFGNRPLSEIWTLANPPAGTSNVVVTLSQNDQVVVGAMVFSGVDLATPIDAVPFFQPTGNSGTSASVTVTPVTNNAWVVDVLTVDRGATPTMTPATGRLQRWDTRIANTISGAASTRGPINPAAPVSMGWTWTCTNPFCSGGNSQRWALTAIALRPASSPKLVRWSEVVP